jgi:hypothetical protein
VEYVLLLLSMLLVPALAGIGVFLEHRMNASRDETEHRAEPTASREQETVTAD